jgi:DNA-binding transcriptional ArsR family regulator
MDVVSMSDMQSALAVVQSPEQAAALLDPVRLRVLELMREPESAAGVARALTLPRQRVGYHVRALEDVGLLESVGDRKRGNCVERLLRTTARQFVIAPQALGALGVSAEAFRDRFSSSYLIATAARTIREVGELQERAAATGKSLPTFTLETEVRFASPARQAAFAQALAESLASLVAEYHDETGRTFRVTLGAHPAHPKRPGTSQ